MSDTAGEGLSLSWGPLAKPAALTGSASCKHANPNETEPAITRKWNFNLV